MRDLMAARGIVSCLLIPTGILLRRRNDHGKLEKVWDAGDGDHRPYGDLEPNRAMRLTLVSLAGDDMPIAVIIL